MKRVLKRLLPLALALLLLAGCTAVPDGAASESAPVSPSVEPTASPKPSGGVAADWSVLDSYQPAEELFTRLKAERMESLTPSKEYGLLYPFTGSYAYTDYGYAAGKRVGLVTAEGKIVLDAVCSNIYRLNYYPDEGDSVPLDFYVLVKVEENPRSENEYDRYIYTRALCALDGSWATPFDYESITGGKHGGAVCYNSGTGVARIYDAGGRVVFDMKNFPARDLINPDMFYYGLEFYGDTWMPLYLADGRRAFFDKNGNRLFSDETDGFFNYAGKFKDGLAVVEVNGQTALLREDGSFLIPPGGAYLQPCYGADGKFTGKVIVGDNRFLSVEDGAVFNLKEHGLNDAYVYWNPQNRLFVCSSGGTSYLFDENFKPFSIRGETALNVDGNIAYLKDTTGCWAFIDGKERFFADADRVIWNENGYVCYFIPTYRQDEAQAVDDYSGTFVVENPEGNAILRLAALQSYPYMEFQRDTVTGERYIALNTGWIYSMDGKPLFHSADYTEYYGFANAPMNGLFPCVENGLSGLKNKDNQWVFCLRLDGGD